MSAEDFEGNEAAAAGLLTFVLWLGGLWLEGVVLRDLWRWFAIPAFGVRPLSVAVCIGLSAMISLPVYRYKRRSGNRENLEAAFSMVAVILMSWGIGAIVGRFV